MEGFAIADLHLCDKAIDLPMQHLATRVHSCNLPPTPETYATSGVPLYYHEFVPGLHEFVCIGRNIKTNNTNSTMSDKIIFTSSYPHLMESYRSRALEEAIEAEHLKQILLEREPR